MGGSEGYCWRSGHVVGASWTVNSADAETRLPKYMPANAVPIIRKRSDGGGELVRSAMYTGTKAAEPTPLQMRSAMNDQCAAPGARSAANGCCARLVSSASDMNASIKSFGP